MIDSEDRPLPTKRINMQESSENNVNYCKQEKNILLSLFPALITCQI